ncbi:Fasciclin-like arabinogalactan protein 12 [Asimina triloba]
MMQRRPLISLLFYFSFAAFQLLSIVSAQSPAPAPAPPGPTNLTKILEKAGHFTTFMRLLKITAVADQIYSQLNDTNNGMTVFAPTDDAFSSLKHGTLNSLTDDQKVRLIQFHVISNYIPTIQFQTISNPVSTQAGGTGKYEFPLNITTDDGNSINITTGINNASVSDTVYSDGQLAVYEVDKVLLPLNIFGPHPPPPAPAPPKPKKHRRPSVALPPTADASGTTCLNMPALESSLALLVVVIFGFSWG